MSLQIKYKMACNQLSKMKIRGPAAIVGGILIHLTLGNLYSFGNMMTYMVSYMHERVSPNINFGNFIWVNSIAMAAQGFFMVVGGLMEKRIGPKLTCIAGCSVLSAGIMLTYYTIETSLFTVVLTYGLLSGLGISLTYVTPLACGMQWYPQKKGMINGLIVGGFGLGALGSTNFQTLYLNPQNQPPGDEGYFLDPNILDRVPSLFILLGLIFLAMQYIGCLLISKPTAAELQENRQWEEGESLLAVTDDPNDSPGELPSATTITGIDMRPVQMIKTKTFYTFWMIYLLNTIAVGYINAMYKSFGQIFISDDHYLAEIGSFAAVFNAGGRIVWGRLMDNTSFRTAMRVLTFVMSLLFATMPLTRYMGKLGFAAWVWMIFFTFSGTFSLMPTVVEKAFGSPHYSANYGLLFTSQTISGPLMAAVNQLMLNAVGYTGCFLTISGILSLSVALTFLVPDGL